MPLGQQNLVFDFGSVEQKRAANHLPVGRLIAAENVQQTKAKAFVRRFADAASSIVTGAAASGRSLVSAQLGLIAQSNLGAQVATYDGSNAWRSTGAAVAVPIGLERADQVFPDIGKYATHAMVGTKLFVFSAVPAGGGFGYQFRVVDDDTSADEDAANAGPRTVSGPNVVGAGKAVAAGGFAWLIRMSASTTTLEIAKVDPVTYAVTATTVTLNGADNITNFDVTMNQGTYPLIAVWGAATNGVANSITCFYLDTATGGVKAAPGAVTTACAAAPQQLGGWLSVAAPNTYPDYYLGISLPTPAISVRKFDAGTLVGATPTGTDLAVAQVANGCLTGNVSDEFGLVSPYLLYTDGTVTPLDNLSTTGHRFRTNFTHLGLIRNGFPMCAPYTVGGRWYLVTGCDDGVGLQNATYVYDIVTLNGTANIAARALYHRGGGDFNQRSGAGLVAHDWKPQTVTVNGNDVHYVCNGAGQVAGTYATYRIKLDYAAALGPMVSTLSGRHVIVPGAWPRRLGPDGMLYDVAPAMYPRTITAVAAAGGSLAAGVYSFKAMYVFRSGDEEIKGAFSPIQTVVAVLNNKITFTIPSLRKLGPRTAQDGRCFVKIYVTKHDADQPYLTETIPNDCALDAVTSILISNPAVGETPYTDGGVAERGSPPACYAAFEHRDRVFLLGTEIPDEVWCTSDDPVIWGFDDLTAFRVLAGAGRIYAGASIDYNSAVFWKAAGASVISGPGPDLLGAGSYNPVQVEGAPGCTNPRSTCTTEQGVHFEKADQDGQWLMSRGLYSSAIGAGVKDFEASAVTAVVHVPKRRQVRFYTAALDCLVWDYGNQPDEGAPGQWYRWTGYAQPVNGACVYAGQAHILLADGSLMVESDTVYTAQVPLLKFPLVFAGIAGLACVYEGVLVGSWSASATLRVTYETDGGTAEGGTAETYPDKVLATAPGAVRFLPSNMDAATATVTLSERSAGGGTLARFAFEGVGLVVGIQPGLRRLNVSQNM